MKTALALTLSRSFSIESKGISWHFVRFGQNELFINGPEVILSTSKGDHQWCINTDRLKLALLGAGSMALAGSVSMLMDMAG